MVETSVKTFPIPVQVALGNSRPALLKMSQMSIQMFDQILSQSASSQETISVFEVGVTVSTCCIILLFHISWNERYRHMWQLYHLRSILPSR